MSFGFTILQSEHSCHTHNTLNVVLCELKNQAVCVFVCIETERDALWVVCEFYGHKGTLVSNPLARLVSSLTLGRVFSEQWKELHSP